MHPDTASLAKAILSAAVVGLLLTLLRRAGARAAGLAAAVPVNSMPALFWLSVERGGDFAATAALGSLWGTGLTVLLGLAFARLAQACHAGLAALLAWLAVGSFALLTWGLPAVSAGAAAVATIALVVGPTRPPPGPRAAHTGGSLRTGPLVSMVAAGAMSMLVSELARHGGPRFCGLVAAIPVLAMTALLAGYRHGGVPQMLGVLRGYLDGMLAKAAFLGGLALGWAAGAGAWAWAIGLAVAVLAWLAHGRVRRLRRPAGMGPLHGRSAT